LTGRTGGISSGVSARRAEEFAMRVKRFCLAALIALPALAARAAAARSETGRPA
jgi:hypothetical protein